MLAGKGDIMTTLHGTELCISGRFGASHFGASHGRWMGFRFLLLGGDRDGVCFGFLGLGAPAQGSRFFISARLTVASFWRRPLRVFIQRWRSRDVQV